MIAGIHEPERGEIHWNGRQVHIRTPHDATDLGIATVYQDLALCDNLDIVANLFLGAELRRLGVLDETPMELKAHETLSDLSVTSIRSIRQPVGSLSGGQRQAVAVARAVMSDAKLVIMDEPTAALGVSQTAMVLALIKRLAASGIAVIVISHNLVDVFEVADRLAVLYLGRLVASGPASDFDRQSAVEIMTTGTAGSDERHGRRQGTGLNVAATDDPATKPPRPALSRRTQTWRMRPPQPGRRSIASCSRCRLTRRSGSTRAPG